MNFSKLFFIFIILILITACSQKEEYKLDIPFYKQSSSGNCMQTQIKMALEYYYPEKEFTFEELDNLTGRTPGMWTWTSQLLPVLLDNKLDAYFYSTAPYDKIKEGGGEFIYEYYGGRVARTIIDKTNFKSFNYSVDKLKENDKFFNEKLELKDIENELKQSHVIILLIDSNVLSNRGGGYSGHGITITGMNETHFSIHDSGRGPNLNFTKESLIEAWNAEGTDNDIIIIKGIK
jgi:hypothetical protein